VTKQIQHLDHAITRFAVTPVTACSPAGTGSPRRRRSSAMTCRHCRISRPKSRLPPVPRAGARLPARLGELSLASGHGAVVRPLPEHWGPL